MRKILLFPGAFNPPHYGHADAVIKVLEKYKNTFDELWIAPSGKRNDKDILIGYEHRRAIGSLFVEFLKPRIDTPVKLTTAELDDKSGKFTHEILKEIKSQPDMQVTQLIGLDGFLSIKDGLFGNEESFIIIKKRGYELPKNFSHGSNIIIFDEEAKPISSTQIRDMVKNHDDGYKKLVPKKISDYIEKHNLYCQDNMENVEKAKKVVNYGKLKKEKPLVIVLMGLPGSGKSYLADHLHKKYSFTTLSGENITHAIFGTEKVASGQYKEVYQVLMLIAKDLIEQNACLVIDGTNLKHEFRKQIYEELGNSEIVLFYLVADDEICLRRVNSRGEKYGDPKKILSKCPPETFTAFKAKLELPNGIEKYFELKSDETLLERADEIISKII